MIKIGFGLAWLGGGGGLGAGGGGGGNLGFTWGFGFKATGVLALHLKLRGLWFSVSG